jgi:hypothetical protein
LIRTLPGEQCSVCEEFFPVEEMTWDDEIDRMRCGDCISAKEYRKEMAEMEQDYRNR